MLNVTQNATDEETTTCDAINIFYEYYMNQIVNLAGFFLNLFSVVVYKRLITCKKATREDMYIYLLFKSAVDMYLSLRNALFFLVDNKTLAVNSFFVIRLVEWVSIIYVGFMVQFMSLVFEMLANMDRFRKITLSLQFLKRKASSSVILLAVLGYSASFYSYKFFEYTFIYDAADDIYIIDTTEFGRSDTIKILGFVHSFVRDCLFVLVIVILNILTVLKMKQALKNNRKLTLQHNSRIKSRVIIRKERAEQQITLMMLLTSTLAVMAHCFLFVHYLPIPDALIDNCVYFVGNLCYEMSYTVNFFFYYFLNNNFRSQSHLFLNKILFFTT